MSEPVRRSSRRVKKQVLKVGDFVEVTKGGVVLRGRLVNQVESTQSNQPRWHVTYDDDAWADEELSESSLGNPITPLPSDNEASSTPTHHHQAPALVPAPTPSPASVAAATAARKKNRKNGRFVKSSPAPTLPEPMATTTAADILKKSVSFSQHESAAAASDSSAAISNSKKASAREQRTARRNRLQPDLPPAQPKKRPPVNAGGGGSGGTKSKKSKAIPDEEVVKVPMLTGTLYLYKGIRRRAEFIRKY